MPGKASRKGRAGRDLATVIDPEWRPDQGGLDYAVRQGVVDLNREIEKFRNNRAGKGVRSPDWQAAWCSWCDMAPEFNRSTINSNAGGTKPSGGLFGAVKRMYGADQGDNEID